MMAGIRSRPVQIALVGDWQPEVTAHKAIPLALKRAGEDLGVEVSFSWHHTARLGREPGQELSKAHGIWCVPASPYADAHAALAAIRHAREQARPFLGTCAGFQHAVLEYARNVLGLTKAAHAELDPQAQDALIAPLSCSLVEMSGEIVFDADSIIARAYGTSSSIEEYHCRYGLSKTHEISFLNGPLCIVGRDHQGEARVVELADHPFFVATLFQPERAALKGKTPPLIRAFVAAAANPCA